MAVKNGERIVRVGDPIPIIWNSQDVSSVNIYLTGNVETFDDTTTIEEELESNNGRNSYTWTVTSGQKSFTDAGPVYLVVGMPSRENIKDSSQRFYILDEIEEVNPKDDPG